LCTGAVVVAIIDFQWIKNFSESESIKLTLAAMLNFHMEKSNKMLRTTQIVLLSSLVSFWQRRLKCENLMDNRRWQMNSRWWKYQLTWTFGSGDKIPAHMDVWFRWQKIHMVARDSYILFWILFLLICINLKLLHT
jgi:hypothetical protein